MKKNEKMTTKELIEMYDRLLKMGHFELAEYFLQELDSKKELVKAKDL